MITGPELENYCARIFFRLVAAVLLIGITIGVVVSLLASVLLAADPAPRVQMTVYTAPTTCAPCRKFERDIPSLKRSGWTFGESGRINVIDVEKDGCPDDIELVPTFAMTVDGVEIERVQGYRGRAWLVARFYEEVGRLK